MMRQWVVRFLADVLGRVYERVIRPDVHFCGHGYIGASCNVGTCRREKGEG